MFIQELQSTGVGSELFECVYSYGPIVLRLYMVSLQQPQASRLYYTTIFAALISQESLYRLVWSVFRPLPITVISSSSTAISR